ncbi:MAG: metallophosphoesterase [Planctomycetes bacterium]|nr:metallophosphoesterase [Planctomycetota bacterium]
MMRPLMAVFLVVLAAGCGPFSHRATSDAWLVPGSGRASYGIGEPGAGKPLRVAVYGDVHTGREGHRAVVAAIRREKPDLVIFTGDAVDCRPVGHMPDLGERVYAIPFWPQYYRGRPAFSLLTFVPFPALVHEFLLAESWPIRDADGWNHFLEDSAPLRLEDRVPFVFVPGNHDQFHAFDRAEIARLFGEPGGSGGRGGEASWFAMDVAGVRFVVVNTGTDTPFEPDPLAANGEQLRWLDAQLADVEARGMTAVVCAHFPPVASGTSDPPRSAVTDRLLTHLLGRPCVRLVLSGHSHEYERLELPRPGGPSATFVVASGGGAPPGHEAPERVASSRVLIEGHFHFVVLEFHAQEIRGRFVAVDKAPAGGSFSSPPPVDEFTIPLGPLR